MKRIHLLRPGTFASTDGTPFTFSAAQLAAIAKNYDPARGEAPLTVGHPKTDHPAFGWVERLEFDAGSGNLYAIPKQVPAEFASAVARGAFKKISVALFGPDQAANPKPGDYYIRHVGFLGAHVPAVPGLSPVEFAAAEAPAVAIEFAAPGAYAVASLFRRLRDWLIADKGLDTADQVLPDYAVGDLEAAARMPDEDDLADPASTPAAFAAATKGQAGDHTGGAARAELKRLIDAGMSYVDISNALSKISQDASRSASILSAIASNEIHNPPESLIKALKSIKPAAVQLSASHEDHTMPATTQAALDARQTELDAQAAELTRQKTELEAREATFAAQATATRRAAIAADVDAAILEGRVLPVERGFMVELAASLDAGRTVEFAAADGSRETINLFERWQQFLAALPPRVDTSERAGAVAEAGTGGASFSAPAGFRVDTERLEMHNKALAYVRANAGVSYEQAVSLVEAS